MLSSFDLRSTLATREEPMAKIRPPGAGLWEPDEVRVSSPVLRGPGGEIPPGYLPFEVWSHLPY